MIELSEPVVAVTGKLRRADKVPIFDGSGYVLEREIYHDARGRFEDGTLIRTSPVVARRDEAASSSPKTRSTMSPPGPSPSVPPTMTGEAAIERALCCGPACKRPKDDCVAHTYGRGIHRRLQEAGFTVAPKMAHEAK